MCADHVRALSGREYTEPGLVVQRGQRLKDFRESTGSMWTQTSFASGMGDRLSNRDQQARLEKKDDFSSLTFEEQQALEAAVRLTSRERNLPIDWVDLWMEYVFREGQRPLDLTAWRASKKALDAVGKAGELKRGPEKEKESPKPPLGIDFSQQHTRPVVATEAALAECLRRSLEILTQARREVWPWPLILRSAEDLDVQMAALEEACWRAAFPPGVPAFENGKAREKPPGPLPPFLFENFEQIATSLHVYQKTLETLVAAYYRKENESDFRCLRARIQKIGGLLRTVMGGRRRSVAEEFVEFDPFPWVPSAFDLIDVGGAIADEDFLEIAREMGLELEVVE